MIPQTAMLAFGASGRFPKGFAFPLVAFMLCLIIGPQLELAVRRSRVIPKGGCIFEHSVAVGFLLLTNLVVGRIGLANRSRIWG